MLIFAAKRLPLPLLLLIVPCALFADYGDTAYFTYQTGGAIPSPFYSTVVSQSTVQIPNLAIRTSGQGWIQASLSSSTTPSTLTIAVNPVGLTAGSYSGSVEVWSPNMSNTLDYVIYLTVTPAPPPLTASPSSLTFNAVQGTAPPPSQTLVIGSSLTPGAMITSSSTPPSWLNAGWISVGSAPMSIPISISPSFTNLALGVYTTSLVFEAPFTSQKVAIPITLNVSAPPPILKTNSNQLQFQYVTGSAPPSSQTIQVTSSGSALTAAVSLGASWLTASPLNGTTPFSVNVGVNVNGLAAGTYRSQVTIATGPFGSASTQTVDVTLTVAADTRPVITSVVNAASFKTPISPGAWVSIIGKNLSTATLQATTAFLPTTLNGVSAQLSGIGGAYSLLVDYVSPTQINVFVPHEVAPTLFGSTAGSVVTVTTPAGTVSFSVDCEAIAPALFSYGPNNYAAAEFPDYVVVGTIPGTRAATAGSIISLYGTGLGQTNPAATSINGPVTVRPLALDAVVLVGGIKAKVLWAGMVGIGLYQINVEVPMMPGPGNYAVAVQIGGAQSLDVQLPVQ